MGHDRYFIPEEIIYALGMIPIRLGKGGNEYLVELGARYISSQNCAFIRSCMGMFAENTDPYLQKTDLFAFDNVCMQVFRLGEVSKYISNKKAMFLGIPRNLSSQSSRTYFLGEMNHFTRKLEELQGHTLDSDNLAQSIELFQEIRRLTLDLYNSLIAKDVPISWNEVNAVVHSGYYLDKKRYAILLHELIEEIDSFPSLPSNHNKNVKIIISGSPIAPGDTKLNDIITQVHGTIVGDDLWSGRNMLLNMKIRSPSIAGIADAYLNWIIHHSLPCFDNELDNRVDNLIQTVRETQAQGVIYHTIRYCDSATLKTMGLKNRLKNEGIPLLEIHTEYSKSDLEAIRTRIEAFFEMIMATEERGVLF
ncbi:2-hydroxyacyl-CoA dehydratase family protein [Methanospirillum sp.]|uniref:2-hydroxyacyl-CoA dehydratase family protein n=1 Tax=Methanospirillum sp. TaxID=45200 RepID=UPI00359F70C9